MDRRDTLKFGAALFGSAWWLGCSPEGSDDAQNASAPRAKTPLGRALAAARENGKPVLVFVAPEPPMTSSRLAQDVSEALNSGGRELLLDLALCELACAAPTQVASELSASVAPGDVGLIEDVGGALTWSPIRFCAPERSTDGADPCDDATERARRNAANLREALAGSPAVLATRVAAARRALPAPWVARFEAQLAQGETPTPDELDRGAAIVRVHPAWPSTHSAALQAVGARVLVRPPEGSRWASNGGCGSYDLNFLPSDSAVTQALLRERRFHSNLIARGIDPDSPGAPTCELEALTTLCGMAYSSQRSNAFLVFYVDEA